MNKVPKKVALLLVNSYIMITTNLAKAEYLRGNYKIWGKVLSFNSRKVKCIDKKGVIFTVPREWIKKDIINSTDFIKIRIKDINRVIYLGFAE